MYVEPGLVNPGVNTSETLTVFAFLVDARYPPIRQDLNVEADAHVTVKPSESFYPQQVLSVCCFLVPFAPGHTAALHQGSAAESALFVAADRWKSSEQTAREDPIQEHKKPGPGRHHRCANSPKTTHLQVWRYV